MMQTRGMKLWSGLNVALGALSFTVLLDGIWFWIGFACAAAALILGGKGRKSPYKGKQICSVASIVLAIGAAVCYLISMFSMGYSMPDIL
ncbi:hypothetical protein [Christensenella tenuis]|jgi:hypothetical protein|uniref:Uncharacterized protein n=1 Tax=Christensenella tenuis TaxID=2763033 RepID=A0ABR7EDZ6_9FIRM|nr:hypothetical protein [Christensenella tenuis]MBC5647986.1 hypothetical protein [Christensenella tenuis]